MASRGASADRAAATGPALMEPIASATTPPPPPAAIAGGAVARARVSANGDGSSSSSSTDGNAAYLSRTTLPPPAPEPVTVTPTEQIGQGRLQQPNPMVSQALSHFSHNSLAQSHELYYGHQQRSMGLSLPHLGASLPAQLPPHPHQQQNLPIHMLPPTPLLMPTEYQKQMHEMIIERQLHHIQQQQAQIYRNQAFESSQALLQHQQLLAGRIVGSRPPPASTASAAANAAGTINQQLPTADAGISADPKIARPRVGIRTENNINLASGTIVLTAKTAKTSTDDVPAPAALVDLPAGTGAASISVQHSNQRANARGKRQCPKCQSIVGNAKRRCQCGHEFNVGGKARGRRVCSGTPDDPGCGAVVGNAKRTCSCGRVLISSSKSKRVKRCPTCFVEVGNAKRMCSVSTCRTILIQGLKAAGTKACPACNLAVGNAKRTCSCGHVFIAGQYSGKPKGGAKKKCPQCLSEVGNASLKCKKCGFVFTESRRETSRDKQQLAAYIHQVNPSLQLQFAQPPPNQVQHSLQTQFALRQQLSMQQQQLHVLQHNAQLEQASTMQRGQELQHQHQRHHHQHHHHHHHQQQQQQDERVKRLKMNHLQHQQQHHQEQQHPRSSLPTSVPPPPYPPPATAH